tara:strand:- start:3537 stop:4043 length:507 start_codon:yes stop_codon:yes gene_type:complete
MNKQITLSLLLAILLQGCTITPKEVRRAVKSQNNDTTEEIKEFKEIKLRRTGTIANDFNNVNCMRKAYNTPEINDLAIGVCDTKNGKFLVFDMPQHSFFALQIWIRKRHDWSLTKAINKHAPKEDSNNPNAYIRKLCSDLKCKPSTKLRDINEIKLMVAIAKKEGFKI